MTSVRERIAFGYVDRWTFRECLWGSKGVLARIQLEFELNY